MCVCVCVCVCVCLSIHVSIHFSFCIHIQNATRSERYLQRFCASDSHTQHPKPSTDTFKMEREVKDDGRSAARNAFVALMRKRADANLMSMNQWYVHTHIHTHTHKHTCSYPAHIPSPQPYRHTLSTVSKHAFSTPMAHQPQMYIFTYTRTHTCTALSLAHTHAHVMRS